MSKMMDAATDSFIYDATVRRSPKLDALEPPPFRTGQPTVRLERQDIAHALLAKLDHLYAEVARLRENRVQLVTKLAAVNEERQELRVLVGELRTIAEQALDQRDEAWAELVAMGAY